MRYGIFSDVHSNLEAFTAVINAYKNENIDKYIFAGDIVGYAANPRECIALLKGIDPIAVCGNHDWAVAGKTSIDNFNEYAKAAVLWTKEAISNDEKKYLGDMELEYKNEDLTVVHGSLDDPEDFNYIFNFYDATKTLEVLKTRVCFVGHSHAPLILYSDIKQENRFPKDIKQEKIKLEQDKKYLINVGSVGQPRDFDPRACYCVFDTDKKEIELKRVKYDIKTAQEKILRAGLPEILANRLGRGM